MQPAIALPLTRPSTSPIFRPLQQWPAQPLRLTAHSTGAYDVVCLPSDFGPGNNYPCRPGSHNTYEHSQLIRPYLPAYFLENTLRLLGGCDSSGYQVRRQTHDGREGVPLAFDACQHPLTLSSCRSASLMVLEHSVRVYLLSRLSHPYADPHSMFRMLHHLRRVSLGAFR